MEGQKYSKFKVPIFTVTNQFKLALIEVAKCSQAGHMKYTNDVDWQNFKRVENPQFEYKNAAMRHLLSEDKFNGDMKEYGEIRHSAQAIWNLLAALEIELENEQKDISGST